MNASQFLQKLASSIFDCIRHCPNGGVWNTWHFNIDGRFFLAYVWLDVFYTEVEGETFLGLTERYYEPVSVEVKDIEVYETDSLYDELPEEEWDVSANSATLKSLINKKIYDTGF